eukprot:scaffold87057_cov24-Tisochrysis_lutea.AAC.4
MYDGHAPPPPKAAVAPSAWQKFALIAAMAARNSLRTIRIGEMSNDERKSARADALQPSAPPSPPRAARSIHFASSHKAPSSRDGGSCLLFAPVNAPTSLPARRRVRPGLVLTPFAAASSDAKVAVTRASPSSRAARAADSRSDWRAARWRVCACSSCALTDSCAASRAEARRSACSARLS